MLSKRTQTIENKEFILITLTPQFESATPKRVLAFDVDDTMLDWTLSSFYHSLVLNKEKELRETLENAKKEWL